MLAKRLVLLFIAIVAVISTMACADISWKPTSGAIYAEHPKSDILGTVVANDHVISLICDDRSKPWLVSIFENDFLGPQVIKDVEIGGGAVCGPKLWELQRLAEIGKKYDKH